MITAPLTGQCQRVEISGYVKDSLTQAPLYPATIYNKTLLVAAHTDSTGYYIISAHYGDVLTFSYLGYSTEEYKVPFGLSNIMHTVQMTPKSEQLQAVTILGLTPYQADSLDRIKTFKNYLDKPRYGFLSDASVGTGVGLSLNLDYFSKESRRKRRFHKMYFKFEQDAFIDSRYTPELVKKLTGLEGDSLTMFLYRYKPAYDFTRYATDLEFWSWIISCYRNWTNPPKVAKP